jgi:hypothetical protein
MIAASRFTVARVESHLCSESHGLGAAPLCGQELRYRRTDRLRRRVARLGARQRVAVRVDRCSVAAVKRVEVA